MHDPAPAPVSLGGGGERRLAVGVVTLELGAAVATFVVSTLLVLVVENLDARNRLHLLVTYAAPSLSSPPPRQHSPASKLPDAYGAPICTLVHALLATGAALWLVCN